MKREGAVEKKGAGVGVRYRMLLLKRGGRGGVQVEFAGGGDAVGEKREGFKRGAGSV